MFPGTQVYTGWGVGGVAGGGRLVLVCITYHTVELVQKPGYLVSLLLELLQCLSEQVIFHTLSMQDHEQVPGGPWFGFCWGCSGCCAAGG